VTTFFVWGIFINKNNMNFQVNLGYGVNQEQKVITSWANNFQSFTTWVNYLTNLVTQTLQNSYKLYLTVLSK
jgi:hypothetical protein